MYQYKFLRCFQYLRLMEKHGLTIHQQRVLLFPRKNGRKYKKILNSTGHASANSFWLCNVGALFLAFAARSSRQKMKQLPLDNFPDPVSEKKKKKLQRLDISYVFCFSAGSAQTESNPVTASSLRLIIRSYLIVSGSRQWQDLLMRGCLLTRWEWQRRPSHLALALRVRVPGSSHRKKWPPSHVEKSTRLRRVDILWWLDWFACNSCRFILLDRHQSCWPSMNHAITWWEKSIVIYAICLNFVPSLKIIPFVCNSKIRVIHMNYIHKPPEVEANVTTSHWEKKRCSIVFSFAFLWDILVKFGAVDVWSLCFTWRRMSRKYKWFMSWPQSRFTTSALFTFLHTD